jgi:hypothetical protein
MKLVSGIEETVSQGGYFIRYWFDFEDRKKAIRDIVS